MTLKEKFKKISYETNTWDELYDSKVKIADDLAIEFALYLSENMYENMYNDINKNGKTWVSYLQEGCHTLSTAERFTIQELLEIFKKEKGL